MGKLAMEANIEETDSSKLARATWSRQCQVSTVKFLQDWSTCKKTLFWGIFLGVVFYWYCSIGVGFLSGRGQNRTYKTLLVISRDLLLQGWLDCLDEFLHFLLLDFGVIL